MLHLLRAAAARLRELTRRSAVEAERDEEFRFHLEMEVEHNRRRGMSEGGARRAALLAFGGVQRFREETREARGIAWLDELANDVRFTLRSVRRSPVIACAAVLTLAIGLGAATAIFSAVNAVILRPLPLPAPDRLVMLWEENPDRDWYMNNVAGANVLDWREQVAAFEDVAAFSSEGRVTMMREGEPEIVRMVSVTGTFFSVLGVRPRFGRGFREQETWQEGAGLAIVSHRLWRDRLGSDPGVLDRTIEIEGVHRQIVGVMPEEFAFPSATADVWVPMAWDPEVRAQVWFRRAHWMRAVARLERGVSLEQARAQLREVAARLEANHPETNASMGAGLTPLHEFLVGDTRLPLLIVLAAVGLLLLIACTNVANLLLVRAAERERDVALRVALGARRSRIVRQAITESLVLASIGGAAGLAIGVWGTRVLGTLQPQGLLRVQEFGMDWRVLAFVFAVTTVCGVIFGIAPALWSGGRRPSDVLREGGGTGTHTRRARSWAEALAVAEVALALLLMVGAGLLVRSHRELRRVDPGFNPEGVLSVWINLPGARYSTGALGIRFYEELRRRSESLRGVESASVVSQVPLTGANFTTGFIAAGRAPSEHGTELAVRSISPGYLRTMRVPILKGRMLTDSDRFDTPRVAVINEVLAETYFAGEEPVGQRIALAQTPDSTTEWWTIVGVIGSEHQTSLAVRPQIEINVPYAQRPRPGATLLIRTRSDPAALAPAVRRIVGELDPQLAIQELRPMSEIYDASLARERYFMTILLGFAGVGLVLALVGIYGVLAQMARARTREMGIRIALGAHGTQVRWLLVRHGIRLTAIGVAIGVAAALGTTQMMRSLLFGVASADLPTYLAVATLVLATGLVAVWLPALRVSRADPVQVLRAEQ